MMEPKTLRRGKPPSDSAFETKLKKAEDIIARYRNTLRALAK